MSYKIIVARYNENIEWLNNEMDNCIIYNKGEALGLNNEIMLENFGRESETYLRYIIDNYDQLPDIIIFTQANISDHRGSNDINYLLGIKNDAFVNGKSYPCYHDETCTYCWWNWNFQEGKYFLEDNYKNNIPILFKDWFNTWVNKDFPNPIYIFWHGIFSVRKEYILKRTYEYYKQLIGQVNHHVNPAEGHFFERSWYHIFH